MGCVRNLLEQHENVWFWVDEDYKQSFFVELAALSAIFADGEPLSRGNISRCMGVHRDSVVGFVPNMVWYSSFGYKDAPLKVDYGKCAEGREDYVIIEPNIIPGKLTA